MPLRGPLRVRALVCVRCPLTGQPAAVTEPAVAAEVHQALDVHLHLAAEVALDLVSASRSSRICLISPSVSSSVFLFGGMLGLLADLARAALADAEEVRERVRDVLVAGEVDACDTSHS